MIEEVNVLMCLWPSHNIKLLIEPLRGFIVSREFRLRNRIARLPIKNVSSNLTDY